MKTNFHHELGNSGVTLVVTKIGYQPHEFGDRYSPDSPSELQVDEAHLLYEDGTKIDCRWSTVEAAMTCNGTWYDALMDEVERDLAEEAMADEADAADYLYECRRER